VLKLRNFYNLAIIIVLHAYSLFLSPSSFFVFLCKSIIAELSPNITSEGKRKHPRLINNLLLYIYIYILISFVHSTTYKVISSHPFPFKQIHKDCVGEFGFSLFLPITLLAKRKEKKKKKRKILSKNYYQRVYSPLVLLQETPQNIASLLSSQSQRFISSMKIVQEFEP